MGLWVAGGDTSPPPLVIGALGNSFTAGSVYGYVGLDSELTAFATAVPIDLSASQYAIDAYTFASHLADATSTTFAASEVWTDCILQGHTNAMQPANLAATLADGRELYERFRAASEGVRCWLWQTVKTPATTLQQVITGYTELKEEIEGTFPDAQVGIIRQGEGFHYLGADLASSHRFYRDWYEPADYHPNENGSAFTALLHYVAITDRTVTGLLSSLAYTALGKVMTVDKTELEIRAYRWAKYGYAPVIILIDPANQTKSEGESATFSITTLSPTEVTYQWYRDGVLLPGETENELTLAAVELADTDAEFRCDATNTEGTVQSLVATLTIGAPMVPIYFNFMRPGFTVPAPASDGFYWNTANAVGLDDASSLEGTVRAALKDRNNTATSVSLRFVEMTGAGANNIGPTGVLGLPNEVSAQFFAVAGGGPYMEMRWEGLTPGLSYRTRFPGLRNVAGTRTTRTTVTGTTVVVVDFNAAVTPATMPEATVIADASGYITIRVEAWTPTDLSFGYLTCLLLDTP